MQSSSKTPDVARTGLVLALTLVFGLAACDSEPSPNDDVADGSPGDGDGDGDEEGLGDVPLDLGGELPEACETWGESRACEAGGTQFCDWSAEVDSEQLIWGECLDSYDCLPGQTLSCGENSGDSSCQLDGGIPYWSDCDPTPLVLNFAGGPVELVASSATFDIAGVGECLATDWPAAHNPWLAIDLDHNGFIDAGHELFGSGTILPSGAHAQTGFVALAQLDQNHDGKIDAADPRFDELLVWRDEDQDKLSMRWELSHLSDEGIASIDLGFEIREQCDARGNCARERSSFEFLVGGQRHVGEVVDIYLACD